MKSKKNFKISLLISIVFLSLLTLIISFIFIISLKPVKINFLNYFDRESDIFKEIKVKEFGDVYLSFNKISKNFELLIEDLVIEDSYFPNILIGIDLKFKKRIYDLSLKIFDGEVELKLPKNYKIESNEASVSKILQKRINPLENFSSIQIVNTKFKFIIGDDIYREYFVDINFNNEEFICSLSEKIEFDNYLSFEYFSKNNQYSVNLESKKFNFNFLKYFFNIEHISFENLYLTGSSNFKVNSDKSVESLFFNLNLDGNLNYKTYQGIEKIKFSKSKIYGEKKVDTIDVILNLNHYDSEFKTALRFNLEDAKFSKINLELDQIKVSELLRIWPNQFQPSVYFWMKDNSIGIIRDLVISMQILDSDKKINLNNLSGRFNFFDTKIRYMDSMPQITDIVGNAIITDRNIKFDILSGLSENLIINGGVVDLYDLNSNFEKAHVVLEIFSKNQEVIRYLNTSPINKKNYVKLQNIYGDSSINLELKFPLILDLLAENIKYKSSVVIENAVFKEIFNNYTLNDFSLNINIDNSDVKYSGIGSIFNSEAKFSGKQFVDGNNLEEEIIGKYFITNQVFESLTYVNNMSYNGNIEVDFKIIENDNGLSKIEGIGSLGGVELSSDFLGKDLNFENGKLRFLIRPYDNLFSGFVDVKTSDLEIEINTLFNNDRIIELDVPRFISPLQDFNLNYKISDNKMSISGNKITLDELDIFEESSFDTSDLSLNLEVGVLKLGSMSFNDSKINFYKSNNIFEKMVLDLKGENDFHKISIEDEIDKKKFVLESNYIPGLLNIFDIDLNIGQGSLKIEGLKPKTSSEYEGVIVGKNIVFFDAPFFANFFSIFSLDGFAQKLKDGGIIFNSLNANYKFGNDKLKIIDSLLKGSELGIQFDTVMGMNDDYFFTNGSIIPAYTINTLITKFPILGDIITAGSPEDGLIGANFRVEKIDGEYEVFYNPISVFVPNIIKNFLGD